MKQLIIFGLIAFIGLLSCRKDELEISPSENSDTIDLYFTDLHDTLIFVPWANGGVDFSLDIDKDTTIDVKLTVYSYYSNAGGGNYSENYLKIIPLNGYKIALTDNVITTWSWNPTMTDTIFSTDTIMIPKVYFIGDTLSINDNYSENSQMIHYYQSPDNFFGFTSYSGLSYGINVQDDEYFYFGFYKLFNANTRLAWLKVKLPSYSSIGINLNSSYYIDEEILIITELF